MKSGFVKIETNETSWEVPERYKNLSLVESGVYGQVCSAYDTCRNFKVAIKKLSIPFQSANLAKLAYREIKLLKHMNHENVIGLLDVFTPSMTFEDFKDVYLVSHWMGADLRCILNTQNLRNDHIQFLVYQILRGLKYIHSAGIIHKHLEPSNIAVNEDCELKILDLGHENIELAMTWWYKAPELLLNGRHSNPTVDIWSVGCILGELLTSKVLFPGTDRFDQLTRIMVLCGKPNVEVFKNIDNQEARHCLCSFPSVKKKNFRDVFSGAHPDAISLLEELLEWEGVSRPTAMLALAHPYLSQYADPTDEPMAPHYDSTWEGEELTVKGWRGRVHKEVNMFEQPHIRQINAGISEAAQDLQSRMKLQNIYTYR